jgi:WD40 repeat protein
LKDILIEYRPKGERMQTHSFVKKLLILAGLIVLTFGSHALAGRLPEVWPASAAGLPPLSRLHLPAQTVEGISASVESYYADASRIVFKVRIKGKDQPHALENISLTNSKNEEINTGYAGFPGTNDPSVIVLEMIPAYALAEKRLDGQLSFSIPSADGSEPPARFHFDLDLPIHPVKTYMVNQDGTSFSTPGDSENAYTNPILLERLAITPAFTWFHLCYNKPNEADWMIGHDAIVNIGGRTSGIGTYNLLYDSSMGGGTKGGEPGWTPVGNYQRCVKIGFPIGSEVNLLVKITLTIPTLEQSMPEVIPQEQLETAYPKLLAQGIDLEWHRMDGGAYPEWKKLPSGMNEQEAYQKFIDALGYTFPGPWVYTIYLEPRDSSQPIFSTSTYGAAAPVPVSSKSVPAETIQGQIRSFDLSPDRKSIAFATSEGIVLYDLESRKQMRVLNETENFFNADWSSNGENLAAGGLVMQDPEVGKPDLIVWDTSTWQVTFEPTFVDPMTDTLYGDVAWSPDSRYLATSNGGMGVTTFDVATGRIVSKQDIFAGATSDISWSPDGSRLIATGDMAYGIRRWKVNTDEWVRLFDQRASFSLAVLWSPDGQRIASGHIGGTVCLWTAATNHCDGFIQAHQTDTFSLAWSPDGSQLATGGGVIRIWDAQTGLLTTSFALSKTSVYAKMAWLKPDLLISLETGYGENHPTLVRFWNPLTGELLLEFQGEEGMLWQ